MGEIWLAHVFDRFHEIPHYIWLIINKGRSINQTLLIWWKLTGVCYIPAPVPSCGRMTCLVWHDKCLCFLILSFCHLSSTSAARKMTNLPSREWERETKRKVTLLRTLERTDFPSSPSDEINKCLCVRSVSPSVSLSWTNTITHQKIQKALKDIVHWKIILLSLVTSLHAALNQMSRVTDGFQRNGLFYLKRLIKAWYMWPLLIISKSSTKPHEHFHLIFRKWVCINDSWCCCTVW